MYFLKVPPYFQNDKSTKRLSLQHRISQVCLACKQSLLSCQVIQKGSPVDSNVVPIPSDMGGYEDKVIMAAGTFTEGSTIELSCDGPIRSPYIAYMQGGLTYDYGRYGVLKAIEEMQK